MVLVRKWLSKAPKHSHDAEVVSTVGVTSRGVEDHVLKRTIGHPATGGVAALEVAMYHDWNNSIAVLKMLIAEKSRNHGADNTVNKFSELSVADAATPSLPREPSQRSSMGASLFSEKN